MVLKVQGKDGFSDCGIRSKNRAMEEEHGTLKAGWRGTSTCDNGLIPAPTSQVSHCRVISYMSFVAEGNLSTVANY